MKPGGWAILQSPVDITRKDTLSDPSIKSESEREKYYWQKDHLRLFGLDYKDKLASVGFDVKVEEYIKDFTQEQVDRFRISSPKNDDSIYLCIKPINVKG